MRGVLQSSVPLPQVLEEREREDVDFGFAGADFFGAAFFGVVALADTGSGKGGFFCPTWHSQEHSITSWLTQSR